MCAQLSSPPPQRVLNVWQLHARLHVFFAGMPQDRAGGDWPSLPPLPPCTSEEPPPCCPQSQFPPFPSAKHSHLRQAAALALPPQPCGHISLAFKALKQPHLGSSPGSPSRPLHTLPSTFETQRQGYTCEASPGCLLGLLSAPHSCGTLHFVHTPPSRAWQRLPSLRAGTRAGAPPPEF